MDPNYTLREIDSALTSPQWGEDPDDLCVELRQWLLRGGFEPEWDRYPAASRYFLSQYGKAA